MWNKTKNQTGFFLLFTLIFIVSEKKSIIFTFLLPTFCHILHTTRFSGCTWEKPQIEHQKSAFCFVDKLLQKARAHMQPYAKPLLIFYSNCKAHAADTVFENLSKSLILQHCVALQNATFLGSFQTFCTEETIVHSKISTHTRHFFCSLSCTIFLEKTYGWSMCVHNFFLEFTKTLDSAQFWTIQRENPDLQKKDDR